VYVEVHVKESIYGHAELGRRLGVDEATLSAWEQAKILRPFGVTAEGLPFYTEEAVRRGEQIQRLTELGYGLREIQKIIRKIGLPQAEGAAAGGKPLLHKYLTVGTLAERVGVSPRTIKHWEEKGIIEPDMRSEGGFRFYSEIYVFLCKLIQDLQLFGYPLDRIKTISDMFRDFEAIRRDPGAGQPDDVAGRLDAMLAEIGALAETTEQLKAGIGRWENLLRAKKKEIAALRRRQQGRLAAEPGGAHVPRRAD
jgi:DNA-binding transcriptional MerR regulator